MWQILRIWTEITLKHSAAQVTIDCMSVITKFNHENNKNILIERRKDSKSWAF